MKLIRSRFRQDFDAAVTKFVVFGGKGILIDSNLADGGFWRKLPGGEAVNVDLTAVRTGGRTSESLEFRLQFVGVVGKRLKILALHDHRSSIVRRIDIDSGGGIGNLHFFLFDLDDQPNIQLLCLPGENSHILLGNDRKTLGDRFQCVGTRNQPFEFVEAIAVGGGVQRGAAGIGQTHRGFGNHSARGVGDDAIQCASGRLRTQIPSSGKSQQKKNQIQ